MENRFLCRGKRIGNGEWVEGFLVPFAGDEKTDFGRSKRLMILRNQASAKR